MDFIRVRNLHIQDQCEIIDLNNNNYIHVIMWMSL